MFRHILQGRAEVLADRPLHADAVFHFGVSQAAVGERGAGDGGGIDATTVATLLSFKSDDVMQQ